MSDFQLYKAYAGLSNPDTPEAIQVQMKKMAVYLEEQGYTLRTNGGKGGEEALEAAVKIKEIHLPWKKFNDHDSKFNKTTDSAKSVIRNFAPSFDTLKPAVQIIVASKAHVILGKDLQNPVKFLICWTQDGAETVEERNPRTGFIGVGIALAASLKIPVFNLQKPDALDRLKQFILN